VGEIVKVYLYSKIPLAPQQEEASLKDILEQARQGFWIELQREVFAHTAEEMFIFLVKKIEPPNKFYGLVDKDTVFEVMHDEPKKVIPICASPEKPTLTFSGYPPEPSPSDETDRLKSLVDDIEALRAKHGITYEFLHKLVDVMEDFG